MEENEEIAFLYHLVDGYAESSLACHIATLAGLPDELVKRAHQVSTHESVQIVLHEVSTVAKRKKMALQR